MLSDRSAHTACGLPKQNRGLSSDFRDEQAQLQATRFNVKVSEGSRGSVKKGLGISLVEVYKGHGNLLMQSVKGPKRANRRIYWLWKTFWSILI